MSTVVMYNPTNIIFSLLASPGPPFPLWQTRTHAPTWKYYYWLPLESARSASSGQSRIVDQCVDNGVMMRSIVIATRVCRNLGRAFYLRCCGDDWLTDFNGGGPEDCCIAAIFQGDVATETTGIHHRSKWNLNVLRGVLERRSIADSLFLWFFLFLRSSIRKWLHACGLV